MFPEEKVRIEVTVMRFIQDKTSIPVPSALHWGKKKDRGKGTRLKIITPVFCGGQFAYMANSLTKFVSYHSQIIAHLTTSAIHHRTISLGT
jgi:hypothetical protein